MICGLADVQDSGSARRRCVGVDGTHGTVSRRRASSGGPRGSRSTYGDALGGIAYIEGQDASGGLGHHVLVYDKCSTRISVQRYRLRTGRCRVTIGRTKF